MFTGLIKALGMVKKIEHQGNLSIITIASELLDKEKVAIGESMAVNGLCLTITAVNGKTFTVQAVFETLDRSTVGQWQAGKKVNLERPLTLAGFLDGHLVTGHVDSLAKVEHLESKGEAYRIVLSAPQALNKYIAEKGSVALDGISLTVAERVGPRQFAVAVIPHTYHHTTAYEWRPGHSVHLEVDILARYLEQLQTDKAGQGLSKALLNRYGY